jgi:uncharacterized lipoprotein YajG
MGCPVYGAQHLGRAWMRALVLGAELGKSGLVQKRGRRTGSGMVPLAKPASMMGIVVQVAFVGLETADQRPEQTVQPLFVVIAAARSSSAAAACSWSGRLLDGHASSWLQECLQPVLAKDVY